MATVRPMGSDDIADAVEVWETAFAALGAALGRPRLPRSAADAVRLHRRLGHFLATDPTGSWVAEEAGAVVGLSQATVREGRWTLSLLGIAPGSQGRGIGRALLEAAMTTLEPGADATIASSQDRAAMSLYSSAGFDLHPAVVGLGTVRPGAVAADPDVEWAGAERVGAAEPIDRAVRGSARTADLRAMLAEPGCRLALLGDRAYAVARDDRVITLAAADERSATRVLETALARAGGPFEVGWLSAGQQWAIRSLVDAGVAMHPYGPLMVRGRKAPPVPYIPSGGYG